jgi:hypothetical protein
MILLMLRILLIWSATTPDPAARFPIISMETARSMSRTAGESQLLPLAIVDVLRGHLEGVRCLHDDDFRDGAAGVLAAPDALTRKFPMAARMGCGSEQLGSALVASRS